MGRRPLAAHRLSIEVDLVTAGDLDTSTLVHSLTQLATAGLHGMVTQIVTVCLDGVTHQATDDLVPNAASVKPPPDPRVAKALRELEEASKLLRSIDKLSPVAVAAS